MLRAQRIRRKLGSDDGTDEPEKPNGMHWATYKATCRRHGVFRSAAFIVQPLSDSDRPMLRAQRIRWKLGSDDGMGEPEKPNGMHWTTYNRLLDRADELDELGWMSAFGGLLLSAG